MNMYLKDNAKAVIATLSRYYKIRNQPLEAEVLAAASPEIVDMYDHDEQYAYCNLILAVPVELYAQLADPQVFSRLLDDQINEYLQPRGEHIRWVVIQPNFEETTTATEIIRQLSQSQFGLPSADPRFQSDIFMIMPFKNTDVQKVYEDHVCVAAKNLGMTIKRGDDFWSKHYIIAEIWSAINAATIIIADCTGRNANVFYELGIAHTLGKNTILITSKKNDIPFNVQSWRAIIYKYTPPGMKIFEGELTDAIRTITASEPIEKPSTSSMDEIPF